MSIIAVRAVPCQSFGDHALFQQIAKEQHAQQHDRAGCDHGGDQEGRDRKNHLLAFGDFPRRLHANQPFFARRQQSHDRRLDDRHQRHVRISGDRDRTQQVRGKLGGQEKSPSVRRRRQ